MTICPFCPENERVQILQENPTAYLVAALDSNGIKMPLCYLAIPKQHIESVRLLPENWHSVLINLVERTPEFQEGVSFNISYNEGRAAGQRIPHVHAWIVFRQDEIGTQAEDLGLAALVTRAKSKQT